MSATRVLDVSLWGSDPLYWTHLILLNIHVTKYLVPNGATWQQVNEERARLRCNSALPNTLRVVCYAHLMGTLVRKSINSQCSIFTIDDGTALVDCVLWTNTARGGGDSEYRTAAGEDADITTTYTVQLGTTIRCLGKLEWPQAKYQSVTKTPSRRLILTQPIVIVRQVSEELRHWHMAMDLWTNVYTRSNNTDAVPTTTTMPSITFKFGGELEDEVMQAIRQSNRMPLLNVTVRDYVLDRFPQWFPVCFQSQCVSREERVALCIAAKHGGEENSLDGVMRRLCRNGHILVIDPKLDLFALITHTHFLAPAILKALASTRGEFIHHNVLLEKLRQDPNLHTVPNQRFDRSLSRLLDDSVIYEGEANTFAVFQLGNNM